MKTKFETTDGYRLTRTKTMDLPEDVKNLITTEWAWTNGDLTFEEKDGRPYDDFDEAVAGEFVDEWTGETTGYTPDQAEEILKDYYRDGAYDDEEIESYISGPDDPEKYFAKIANQGELLEDFRTYMGEDLGPQPVTPDMNVHDYFYGVFGTIPRDETLRTLLLSSPCGKDCKRVIDLAKAYHDGVDKSVRESVITTAKQAIAVLWRG